MPGGSNSQFATVDQAVNQMQKLEAYIAEGMDSTVEIATDLLDYDKETSDEKLTDMRTVMEEYIKMEQQMQQFTAAIEFVKQEAKKGAMDTGNLEDLLDEKLGELQQATIDDDLRTHEKFVTLEQKIQELRAGDDSGAITMDTEAVEVDPNADVAMTQQTVVTKCPYTGKEMTDPVRNKLCGHSYERQGVTRLMKTRQGKAKCPVAGCINEKTLEPQDLEENTELKKLLEQRRRQGKKAKKPS